MTRIAEPQATQATQAQATQAQPREATQAAPPTPAAPARAAVAPTLGQEVPTTSAELDALYSKRAELNNQLESLTDRREELVEQARGMGLEERRGHETRIKVIDDRTARIEQEIYQADEAIAAAVSNGVSTSGTAGQTRAGTTVVDASINRAIRNEVEDSVYGALSVSAFTVLSLYVVWRGFRRFIWKKKPAPPLPDQTGRLDQLQQSMDVIAIEVERISEAQRFVARVMNEKLPGIGAGEGQSVPLRERDAIRLDAEKHRR